MKIWDAIFGFVLWDSFWQIFSKLHPLFTGGLELWCWFYFRRNSTIIPISTIIPKQHHNFYKIKQHHNSKSGTMMLIWFLLLNFSLKLYFEGWGCRYLTKILESLETPHSVLIRVLLYLLIIWRSWKNIRKPFIALKKILKKVHILPNRAK